MKLILDIECALICDISGTTLRRQQGQGQCRKVAAGRDACTVAGFCEEGGKLLTAVQQSIITLVSNEADCSVVAFILGCVFQPV